MQNCELLTSWSEFSYVLFGRTDFHHKPRPHHQCQLLCDNKLFNVYSSIILAFISPNPWATLKTQHLIKKSRYRALLGK